MRPDQQQQQKKGGDLRVKLERQQIHGGGPSPLVGQRPQGASGSAKQLPQLDKPAGYDERRRQREMGRRTAAYDPESSGMGERGGSRAGSNNDPYNEHDRRTVIRSKMYSDKMMGSGGGSSSNNNKNKSYEYGGGGGVSSSNRGMKRMSRSPPQSYNYDNNEYNNRHMRESMDKSAAGNNSRRGGGGRQELKRPLSSERDAANKRRKQQQRRDSSSERAGPGNAQGGSVGNLKELEFRARALQSLLSKKEKSNEARRGGGDRDKR